MAKPVNRGSVAGADVAPVILTVDDDPAVLASLGALLASSGYDIVSADGGEKALEMLEATRPDLVLLDIDMPGMDGFSVCASIQADETFSDVPIILLSTKGSTPDRRRTFEAGAMECLEKPVAPESLTRAVREHLRTTARWSAHAPKRLAGGATGTFTNFKHQLAEAMSLGKREEEELSGVEVKNLYSLSRIVGIRDAQMAKLAAEYLGLKTVETVDPERTLMGILPLVYCRANRIVPVEGSEESVVLVLANPFDQEVLDSVSHVVGRGRSVEIAVAEPSVIDDALWPKATSESGRRAVIRFVDATDPTGRSTADVSATATLMQSVLDEAVGARASDIHIEAKHGDAVVRVRVDGDMRDFRRLTKDEARRLVSRFKVIGGMDIAERRRPQDGGAAVTVRDKPYKLRIATSATPHGESMVIRIVDPSGVALDLTTLGMTPVQEAQALELANRSQGLILVVGPTGSGKSTTVFSILSRVETGQRSLISVEDPVEYRIPFANQMQVNERGGVTFDSLLRSAIRQDPDILFLGEIRDLLSGKAAMDFSSSGHLTVTTLHSANATTALFRLERLGVPRTTIADSITGIIAQKLMKRLCTDCRRVRPITDEERAWLAPFTNDLPNEVADPVGCVACQDTGYRGREGVFEVLRFDPEVTAAVRTGKSVGQIRMMIHRRGEVLVGSHGVEKVRALAFSARDVFEQVLLEEGSLVETPIPTAVKAAGSATGSTAVAARPGTESGKTHLLVVEDDRTIQLLLTKFLTKGGYRVTVASDGAEALMCLGSNRFDAIISDINMPNLDGMKFLEILMQKGVDIPVAFVTGRTESEVEVRAFDMGAADFIRKPIRKDVLLARVARLAPMRHDTSGADGQPT